MIINIAANVANSNENLLKIAPKLIFKTYLISKNEIKSEKIVVAKPHRESTKTGINKHNIMPKYEINGCMNLLNLLITKNGIIIAINKLNLFGCDSVPTALKYPDSSCNGKKDLISSKGNPINPLEII